MTVVSKGDYIFSYGVNADVEVAFKPAQLRRAFGKYDYDNKTKKYSQGWFMGDVLKEKELVSGKVSAAAAAALLSAAAAEAIAARAVCRHAGVGDAVMVEVDAVRNGVEEAGFREIGAITKVESGILTVDLKSGGKVNCRRQEVQCPCLTRKQLEQLGFPQRQSNPVKLL